MIVIVMWVAISQVVAFNKLQLDVVPKDAHTTSVNDAIAPGDTNPEITNNTPE